MLIPTARVDTGRSSANYFETSLMPSNVTAGKFGLVGTMPVDGDLYSQPIYIPSVTISGTPRDLIVIATMHNSVYAFDANGFGRVWMTNFGTAWQYPNYPHNEKSPLLYRREVGSASVSADVANGWVFAVTADNSGTWTLRKLALATGRLLASREISGQVTGTGCAGHEDSTRGKDLLFDGRKQLQRTALTTANGRVHVGFGGHAGILPYHGWVMAYAESDLNPAWVMSTTPSGCGGGVWNGGGGLSVLPDGDLLLGTGNGDWDGITQFGQSVVRLKGASGAIVDWFTPVNWSVMSTMDSDLGSSPMMLIPRTTRAVAGAKDYRVFSVDWSCLGHLGGSAGGCPGAQIFTTNARGLITDHSGVYNGAFFDNTAFFPNTNGRIYRFAFVSGTFDTTPKISAAVYGFPGAQMSVSGNGARNAIVWATTTGISALYSAEPGTLRALDPSDLSEYWNSDASGHDALGTLSKYAAPVVANGRVYVSTQSGYVAVYGRRGG